MRNNQLTELLQDLLLEKIEQKVAERINAHCSDVKPEKRTGHEGLLMDLIKKDGYDKALRQKSGHGLLKFLAILGGIAHLNSQRKTNSLLRAIHQHQKASTAAPLPETPFLQKHYGGQRASIALRK